ncbi:MAG TPA: hypothetical protein VFK86_15505 [Bauldia sp.]|nr:hypothetical protein [Bauldia sp.]
MRLAAAIAAGTVLAAPAVKLDAADLKEAARPGGCATEAELLVSRTEVRAAPQPGAAVVTVLEPGTSVYRCEKRGAFLGVMFPEAGGAADCSLRPPGRECPAGWTGDDLETEITG